MTVIDLRGLTCPEPLLRLIEQIRKIEAGTELEVLTTDPGTLVDIPMWAERAGIEVIECRKEEEQIRFVLKKLR